MGPLAGLAGRDLGPELEEDKRSEWLEPAEMGHPRLSLARALGLQWGAEGQKTATQSHTRATWNHQAN